MSVRLACLGLLTAAAAAAPAFAQGAGDVPGRTIVGIVVDSSGRPVDSAEVMVEARRRSVLTGADGRFRLDGIPPARYTVVARKVGHLPDQARVVVENSRGVEVRLQLGAFAYRLNASVTVAQQTGLRGVVSDTGLRALADALVRIRGTPFTATSDTAGRFRIDLPPGSYVATIAHPGFRTQTLSVELPADEGRNIAALLEPAARPMTNREAAAVFDLDRRIAGSTKASRGLFTREYLDQTSFHLDQIATNVQVRQVAEDCTAYIDGGPFTIPLWAITPRELEFLEVYRTGTRSTASSQRMTGGAARPGGAGDTRGAGSTCPVIYAWYRK
ncbi:MAG TPA: carboxypeptidase-like regulatory domain-containing protein [Gemmatimonadaceae bacterium]|nr:carboxypeptidase-like regulatory domain-containing protein [Gemmatimonadaceae bacterium]